MALKDQEEKALERTVLKAEAAAASIKAEFPGAKIVPLPAAKDPDGQTDPEDVGGGGEGRKAPSFGTCRFCGQIRSVDGCVTEEQANEQATRSCDCPDAANYREQIRAEERRKRILEDADQNLIDLFGRAAKTTEAMDLLRELPPLIYDGMLLSVSVKVSWTVSAKLSLSSKGKVVIERKHSEAHKVEV